MPRVSAHTLVGRARSCDTSGAAKPEPGKRGPKFVVDPDKLAAALADLDLKAAAEQARRARVRAEAVVPFQTGRLLPEYDR